MSLLYFACNYRRNRPFTREAHVFSGSSGKRVPKLFAHKAAKDEQVNRSIPVPCPGFLFAALEDTKNCFTRRREAAKKGNIDPAVSLYPLVFLSSRLISFRLSMSG
jgi:hypothetical protein